MNERTLELLHRVRLHDSACPDLHSSHHYTFCVPYGQKNPHRKILLMGFNPGESAHDWNKTKRMRAEESFERNFNDVEQSKSSKRWYENIDYYLPDSEIILTEFIFWSSKNIFELEERIGKIDAANPHLNFCNEINRALLDIYSPRLIIFTGLSHIKLISENFELMNHREITSSSGTRIAVVADGGVRKWIFCRHWTGSFGFSNADKQELRQHILSHLS